MTRFDPNYYVGLADDAAMIQAAVDAACETGETVTIPRRNLRTGTEIWMLPRAVRLHTGSVICLDNCHLRQCDGIFDNIFKNSHARTARAATRAGRQYDIHVYGLGNAILDGGNHNGLVERNSRKDGRPHIIVNTTLHFHNCERVIVENVSILHQRWWGITFHYCANCRVSNIRFMGSSNAPNQDGIDLRTGCSSFVIENISGYTQDDSVALTCLNHGFDESMAVAEMDTSIHNVVIRNITTATVCAQVRLLNQDGRKLYNVLIENVQNYCEIDPSDPNAEGYVLRIPYSEEYLLGSETSMAMEEPYWLTFREETRAGASVRIGENHYYRDNDPKNCAVLGDTYNIIVRNVQSHARYGVTVSCTLCDAVIENVQMYGDAISPVYFGPGSYECISVREIGYARNAHPQPRDFAVSDDERRYGSRYGYDQIAAVYFNGSKATGLRFDGVRANACIPAVFGGRDCDVTLKAENIEMRGDETALVHGDGIHADIRK